MSFPSSSTAQRLRARPMSIRSRNRLDRLSGCADVLEPSTSTTEDPPPLRLLATDPTTILIAGSDSTKRSTLAQELAQEMPADTRFDHADATSELLERAPFSRMVMLTGDLDGLSAESTVHLLGQRYPRLPVLALESPAESPHVLAGVPDMPPSQPSADLLCV